MARFGVIGDPHGNGEALHAALRALDRLRIDRLLCVGDLVGYNAEPNAVAAELAGSATCIAGNHDRIAIGALGSERCWYGARHALEATAASLSERTRAFLAGLPCVRLVAGGIVLFHGCLDDVARYCRGEGELLHNGRLLGERYPQAWLACFGHTHEPGLHLVRAAAGAARVERLGSTGRFELDPAVTAGGGRFFLNPGSIDGARRQGASAQFAVLDTFERTVELGSVSYDQRGAEHKARSAGYRPRWPKRLAGEARSMVRAAVGLLR